ncbi:MAG: hypothetical protein ACM3U2_12345 [Deltaproteobacteria bacterium]
MITRNGMVGLAGACLAVGAAFASAPAPAAAGEKGLTVTPAIYRVTDDDARGPTIQLVHRRYYYGGPGWGYGYYRPYYRPYVYGPPPIISYPAYGYSYGYPAYGYGYPAYGYGYGYPAYGYGYYGPRVSVGVGVW